jgi:Metallo-beta-lactamase superfamily
LTFIKTHGLTLEWILDTHPHADHFSAAGYLKDITGASTGIGERVKEVQRLWKTLYNLPTNFPIDGSQWDHLFADRERFAIGEMEACVLLCPGHTLCSITYAIGKTRPLCMIPFSCRILVPRDAISQEVTLGNYGRAFSVFWAFRRAYGYLPGMTIARPSRLRAHPVQSTSRLPIPILCQISS